MRATRERTEPADPATLRAEKVARFKRDKEVRSTLSCVLLFALAPSLEPLASPRAAC